MHLSGKERNRNLGIVAMLHELLLSLFLGCSLLFIWRAELLRWIVPLILSCTVTCCAALRSYRWESISHWASIIRMYMYTWQKWTQKGQDHLKRCQRTGAFFGGADSPAYCLPAWLFSVSWQYLHFHNRSLCRYSLRLSADPHVTSAQGFSPYNDS